MLTIGLTGGIGAGKTVVAELFAKFGVPIIDADVIARQVTTQGHSSLDALREHFGESIFKSDGSLDRKKLRTIIFDDHKERLWLENLLHPLIRKEIEHQINSIQADYCILVIPLLSKLSDYPSINRVLVVDTPHELQFERVKKRDQTSAEEVKAILGAQTSRQARLLKAQDIIQNDGKIEDLEPQVQQLHQLYLRLATQMKSP